VWVCSRQMHMHALPLLLLLLLLLLEPLTAGQLLCL
jgi:hypothetical protein